MKRFPTYIRYKDSGVEWLGEVPEGWDINKIKYSTYVKGRIGWQGLRSDEFVDIGPYLVTGTDFIRGKVNWDTCYHVSENRYKEDPYIHLRNSDLLITKDGSIGKIAIVENLPDNATLNSGIFLTRCIDNTYITQYMFYLLNSDIFFSFIDFKKAGSTISHLYQNVFVEFSYPQPPLPEQHAIATFLDRETARIDALIEKKERLIALLEEKRAALISHTVTKGLDPSVKMKDSGIEWLGMVPEGWGVHSLKTWWDVIDCKHLTAEYVDDGIPIVSTTEIKPGRINLENTRRTNEEFYSLLIEGRLPKRGDIIYSRNASLGSAAYIDTNEKFCMGQDVCLITSKVQDQLFLTYLLNSKVILNQLNEVVVGSTINRINVGQIKELIVTCPPIEEQTHISQYLDKITINIDKISDAIRKSIELLTEYRSTLISAAVTGKIDVRGAAAV